MPALTLVASVLFFGSSIIERRPGPVGLQASDHTWFSQVSLHTKAPNNFPLRPGQEVQPDLRVATEPGYVSLVICPQLGLYHHPI